MDELGEEIRDACRRRPDLLKPEYRDRDDRHPLEGHCYAASEAYFHAEGGYDAGYTVWQLTHEGESHWFLRGPDDSVVDLTADQFETPVPHDEAEKKGFLTSEPSERARELLDEAGVKW